TPNDPNNSDRDDREDREDRDDRSDRDKARDKSSSQDETTSQTPVVSENLITEEGVSDPVNEVVTEEEVASAQVDEEAQKALQGNVEKESANNNAGKKVQEEQKKAKKPQVASKSAGVVKNANANRARRSVPKTGVLGGEQAPFILSVIPGLLLLGLGLRRKYR
ncbi:MAG: hypothetical protein Q3993_00730, partial [Filifactor alocis]|nr:hypothetical protein [Filifactor alocis]